MTFREDESRIREPHMCATFAWLNRFTRSLLKQHPSKTSIVENVALAAGAKPSCRKY